MTDYTGAKERIIEMKQPIYDRRVDHFIKELMALELPHSKKALRLVMTEMSTEKGYSRHDGRDYFIHPIAIAQTALDYSIVSTFIRENNTEKADRLVSVCLLHDVIEDIPHITKDFLIQEFSVDIANDVDNLSKRDGELFKDYVDRFAQSEISALVKIIDRFNNVSTLSNSSHEHRVRQLEETKAYYVPLDKIFRRYYWEHRKFYFQAKFHMDALLKEIENQINTKEEEIKLRKRIKDLESQLNTESPLL